jgi:DNA-binding SARP family transcriptional activator
VDFSIGSVPGMPARALPVRERARHFDRPSIRGRLLSDAFDVFPNGVLIVSDTTRILTWNPALAEIVGDKIESATSCCEIFGCREPDGLLADRCLTDCALAHDGRREEVIVIPGTSAPVVVAATPVAHGNRRTVVFEVRPAPAAPVAPALPRFGGTVHIRTLGETVVETEAGELRGDWLDQRPGRLLKFLVAHRYDPVHADTIAEGLWPRARPDTTATVRHVVHVLREKLEPGRGRYERSAFILARHGGYVLNRDRVTVDADEFERQSRAGLIAIAANERDRALQQLEHAITLYRDDFLREERFDDWAVMERERLREIAVKSLKVLVAMTVDRDEATRYLERLADLERLDVDIHTQLIAAWLRQGRRGRAIRHYRALQSRLMRELGERLTIDLAELARSA